MKLHEVPAAKAERFTGPIDAKWTASSAIVSWNDGGPPSPDGSKAWLPSSGRNTDGFSRDGTPKASNPGRLPDSPRISSAEAEAQRILGPQVEQAVGRVGRALQTMRQPLARRRELDGALRRMDPKGIVDALRKVPGVAELLHKPAGSRTFPTIGLHTEAVLTNLVEQLPHHGPIPDEYLPALFLATALHDIGKGHSVESFGDSKQQHAFTTPITGAVLGALGYPERTREFVAALIDHDLFGEASRGLVPIDEAAEGLRAAAEMAQVPLDDFVRLSELFYISDAGSYPRVRADAFERRQDGKLVPTRPLHEVLKEAASKPSKPSKP